MMEILVNGVTHAVDVPDDETLLSVLRDDLGLTGTKTGCGEGICGLCTILIDGRPTPACRLKTREAVGCSITTVEGLATRDSDGREVLHPVQRAWLELQVAQCGWCTPGQLMTVAALLDILPHPSNDEIVSALDGVLCRCGSYSRVFPAVRRAAELAATRGEG